MSRQGFVTGRSTGREYGLVQKIDWPISINGWVEVEPRWEARRPHEVLIVSEFSFPTFATRREAVAHLAEGDGL